MDTILEIAKWFFMALGVIKFFEIGYWLWCWNFELWSGSNGFR